MSEHENCSEFTFSVNARHDGSLEAAYFKVSDAPVAWTKELHKNALLVDFDANNKLVGFELLAPVKIGEVMDLASEIQNSRRLSFQNFVRSYAPASLVTS